MRATGNLDIDIGLVQDAEWAHEFALDAISNERFNECEEGEGEEDVIHEEPEIFNPRPLKSRRLEIERLGEAGCRAECFGCVYAGEKDTTIPSDDINRLIEMARQSFGRTDLITLAEAMAHYYAKMRKRINKDLHPGEKRLPKWGAAMILEHLRFHHSDPLVSQVVILSEINELRAELSGHCMEVSNKTGRVRPNKNAIDSYEKLVKLQLTVQKCDSSKMAFTSNNARINSEILTQGVIAHSTKRLHSVWKK